MICSLISSKSGQKVSNITCEQSRVGRGRRKYTDIVVVFFLLFHSFCSNQVLCHRDSISCCKVHCAVVLTPSLDPFEVLHNREMIIECSPVQWCRVICTPGILVNPLLAQALHHWKVVIRCCDVQWCPAIRTTRVLVTPLASNFTCVLSTIAFAMSSSLAL